MKILSKNAEKNIRGFYASNEKKEPLAVLFHEGLVNAVAESDVPYTLEGISVSKEYACFLAKVGGAYAVGEASAETAHDGWQKDNLAALAANRAFDRAAIIGMYLTSENGERVVSTLENIKFTDKRDEPLPAEVINHEAAALPKKKEKKSEKEELAEMQAMFETETTAEVPEEIPEEIPEESPAKAGIQTATVEESAVDLSPYDDIGVDFNTPDFVEDILADEPQPEKTLSSMIITFGKYKGKTFAEAGVSYLEWCLENLKNTSPKMDDFFKDAKAFVEEERKK